MKKISPETRRKVIALIQAQCCNHITGDCVACDTKCAQIARMRPGNERADKEPFACPWFRDAVLPLDKDLEATLIAPHDMWKCEMCGVMFAPGSNRSKYCEPCTVKDRQKRQREYAQKKRGILSTVRT